MQISSNMGLGQLSQLNRMASSGEPVEVSVEPRQDQDGFADSVKISVGGKELESPLLSSLKVDLDAPSVLPEAQAPKLERPVLFLHGFMGVPQEFDDMSLWLSREGQNVNGGIVRADELEAIDGKANLFSLEFSKPYHTVDMNAAEIKATVEAICQKTGASSVDLVCHSKGGLDARRYMMDSEERVDHVVTIGTPHKGTPLADIELFVREDLGRPVKPPIKDPVITQTLRELSVDDVGKGGTPKNKVLHDLNSTWGIQRSRADYMAIAGSGVLTVVEPLGVSFKGDGVVSQKSASSLKGAVAGSIKHKRHGNLPRQQQVMLQVAGFLAGSDSLPDSPETVLQGSKHYTSRSQTPEIDGFLVTE